jgi:hypothetical protein
VDAHNIVPTWLASDHLEYAARTFRPKINSVLPLYLNNFIEIEKHIFNEDYNVITTKLNMGKVFRSLSLSFEDILGERSDRLKYGWEPDGSRIIWDFSNDERRPVLQLTSYEMGFVEHLNAESNAKKEPDDAMFKSEWIRTLRVIKYAMYVIAFMSFFSVLAIFTR